MLKRLFRLFFTMIGGLVGYAIFMLMCYVLDTTGVYQMQRLGQPQTGALIIVFVFIFGVLFFAIAPALSRSGSRAVRSLETDLRKLSSNEVLAGAVGLVIGLIVAYLISQLYDYIHLPLMPLILTVLTYLFLGYLGVSIGTQKGRELLEVLSSGSMSMPGRPGRNKEKKAAGSPKILDTSVIIDGRVYDILQTGFLEGDIIIPEFVLLELQHIADSSDGLKRQRGRRGLDILKKIQTDYGIEIYDTSKEKSLEEIPEVDIKLLKLAQNMHGKVVTNDFNLNKVAGIKDVEVLNINALANTLRPVVLPGETMELFLVKEGKEHDQAVAYLDDGTMIVVEDGRKRIGKQVNVSVTSVLQTAAGRMIFARLVSDKKEKRGR